MSTAVEKFCRENKYTLKEATESLSMEFTKEMILASVERDPKRCLVATYVAATMHRRWRHLASAMVGRTVLWTFDHDKKIATHYLIPAATREVLRLFDVNKTNIPPGTRVTFDPPVGSQTLAEARKRSKKRPGRHRPGGGTIKRRLEIVRLGTPRRDPIYDTMLSMS